MTRAELIQTIDKLLKHYDGIPTEQMPEIDLELFKYLVYKRNAISN